MDNPSIILNGKKIDVRESDGMFKTIVNGLTFMSETFQGLVNVLGNFYTISVQSDYVVPTVPLVDRLKAILTAAPLLTDRQSALRSLEVLAESNPEAERLLSIIKSKPVSYGATYLTRILGKKHFSEVSSIQVSDNVPSILHRSELLKELSDIVRL